MPETREIAVYQHLPAEFMTQKQAQIFKWFNLYQLAAVIFTYGLAKTLGLPTLLIVPLVGLALVAFVPYKGEFVANRVRAVAACLLRARLGQPEIVDFTALAAQMRLQSEAEAQTAVIAESVLVGRTGSS
jgi:hypothetical protein